MLFENINLAAGETLRIDTGQRTATVNGESVLYAIDGKWFNLTSGENEIEISGEGVVEVKIQWRDKYL